MPSTADVHAFVARALESESPTSAHPWRDALLNDVGSAPSLTLLGRLADAEGDTTAALAFLGEAIRTDPYYIDAFMRRANLFARLGAAREAAQDYEAVLRFAPFHRDTLLALCGAAQQAKQPELAVAALHRRIKLGQPTAELCNLLGLFSHQVNDPAAALAAYRQAFTLEPQAPLYANNVATALYHLERYDEALAALATALCLAPEYAVAWYNRGNVFRAIRELENAEHAFRTAIVHAPQYAEPHFGLGCVLLQTNRWEEGWHEYEWRWQVPGLVNPIDIDIPRWNGETLGGRRLLLVAEQGSGDTLQCIRYAQDLAAQGVEVLVWAPVETAALLRRLPYVSAAATNRFELPQADCYAPLMSLPRILQARPDRIPAPPYLAVDAQTRSRFVRELGPRRERLRLGIAWGGNPQQVADRYRSASLSALAPLFEEKGIRWIGLQKDARVGEIASSRMPIEDWSRRIDTFDETAALVDALDGVVSICSAPLHLAGALGLPTIGLLSWAADWRWGIEGSTTPWYPTMHLIRQPALHAWGAAAEEAAALLRTWQPRAQSRTRLANDVSGVRQSR